MEKKFGIIERIKKALESFTISYAFVIMAYVLISNAGVFDPIDNEMALQLMCVCLVIAVFHFLLGFMNIKSGIAMYLLYFGVEMAVALFMGFVVYDFFLLNTMFFICLALMLAAVFAGTFLLAYYDDWKKAQEINEMIRQRKK